MTSLVAVLIDEGDLAAAMTLAEELLAFSRGLKSQTREARALITRAEAEIDSDGAADAEHLREAIEGGVKNDTAATAADAYDVQARAYLAGRRIVEARQAVDRAKAIDVGSFRDRLWPAITAARVHEATSPRDAIAQLRDVADEAAKKGYVRLACEVRLRLGEAAWRAGDRGSARAQLTSVEREATRHGFGLIARKARAATW